MKTLVTFIALLVVVVLAEPQHGGYGHGKPHGKPHHGGGYDHHGPAYYSYGYKVHDDYHKTNFGHEEKRDGKHTSGTYYVHLPDGRVQTVHYNVDGYNGYIADVKYSGKPYHPPAPHGGYKPHKPHHGGYH